MQMEVKTFSDEIQRLRTMLKQQQKITQNEALQNCNFEARTDQQTNFISTLKADNIEMAAIIQTQEQQQFRLQTIQNDYEKKMKYFKKQNLILKNEILKKEKQIEQQQQEHKDKLARYPLQTSNLLEQIRVLQGELEKKSGDLSDLHQVIRKKEKIIQQLEQKLLDSNNEFQDQHEKFLLEKNELLQKSQALKNQLNMVSDKMLGQTQLSSQDIVLKDQYFQQTNQSMTKCESASYCQLQQNKKMIRVKVNELEQAINKKANTLFQSLMFSLDPGQLIETLFSKADEFITIDKLFDMLKGQPFNIQDEKACLQFARYLVENDDESLLFDKEKGDEKNRIKIVFKKLLGSCKLMEIANEYTCLKNICQICQQYKTKLPGTINQLSLKQQIQQNYFTIESLKASFAFLEVNLSDEEYNYIEFQLFKQYQILSIFEINQFLPAFQLENLLKQNILLEEQHKLEEKKIKLLRGQQSPSNESPTLEKPSDFKIENQEQNEQYNFITNQQFSKDFEESSQGQEKSKSESFQN